MTQVSENIVPVENTSFQSSNQTITTPYGNTPVVAEGLFQQIIDLEAAKMHVSIGGHDTLSVRTILNSRLSRL